MTTIVVATIANGSATFPAGEWAPMPFGAITSGSGATIDSGNLVFTDTGPATFSATITLLCAPGAVFNLGYSWDGGAIVEIGEWMQAGTGAVTINGQADATLNGTLALFVLSNNDTATTYWSAGTFAATQPADQTIPYFPAFVPIYPPPPVGNPPPPPFPPPTPPPIGVVPVGPLVGPAIAPAPVPPSLAGVVQPQFAFGSATAPPASAAIPEFTTNSPSPPIVFSNIFTGGSPPVTPPNTTTTAYIPEGTAMGPPIGPALPNPIPPREFMARSAGNGRRRRRLEV